MQQEMMSVDEPAPESMRLGRYRLLMNLGQGGMGAIHLALATGTGEFQKLVVVKELRRDLASNPQFVEMFMQEAKLAGRLNHANVVQTLEASQVGERYFLAMEFLDGQPLSALMPGRGEAPAVPERLLLHAIGDALAGLHYAHELRDYGGQSLQIVHCDVSPHNVFVTYGGQVKVVDFGIAKAVGAEQHDHVFRGRLAYASPEQILGEPVDRRADIFSAGVMLWEAIAQRRFARDPSDEEAIIHHRLAADEPRLVDVVPSVHPLLSEICDRALQLRPEHRFQTAEEFRLALASYAPALDPGMVGQFMAGKFAAQRAARHRLIHDRLGDPSAVKRRPLTKMEPSLGDDVATTVADLSELVERSRNQAEVDTDVKFRSSFDKRWLLLGGLAAAAGVGALLWGDAEPASGTAVNAGSAPLSSAPPPPAEVARLAVPAPRQLEADAPVLQPAEVATEVSEPEPPERSREVVRRPRKKVRQPEEKDVRAAPEAPKSEAEERTGVTASEPAPSTSRRTALKVGEDLPAPGRRAQRKLDVDNPFK